MAVHIQDIEIFSQVEEGLRDRIEALFLSETYQEGENVTIFGEPVQGLYLLDTGQVQVSIPGYEGILATLEAGASFGELSLFNENDVASATVTVSSESADLLFCPVTHLITSIRSGAVFCTACCNLPRTRCSMLFIVPAGRSTIALISSTDMSCW